MISVRHRTSQVPPIARDAWLASVIAVATTLMMLVLLLDALVIRGGWRANSPAASEATTPETITFVVPPRPVEVLIVPPSVVPRGVPAVRAGVARAGSATMIPFPRSAIDSGAAVPAPSVTPAERATRPAPFIPSPHSMRIEPNGGLIDAATATMPGIAGAVPLTTPLTGESRDSILRRGHASVPEAARAREATQGELDEQRRAASLAQRLRDRPSLPPSVVGGTVSLPEWPGTAARRRRDSIAAAETRERLARLSARARAKQDSIRLADSLARRP